jgi:hypothetical protein
MKIFRCDWCDDGTPCGDRVGSCVMIVDEYDFSNPDDCGPVRCPYDLVDEPDWREITC